MMPRIGLMTIVFWRTGVYERVLNIVRQCCPALGLWTLCFAEEVFAKQYWKLGFGNDAPQWAYENRAVKSRCSPNNIKNYCLGMMAPHWAYENRALENRCSPKNIEN